MRYIKHHKIWAIVICLECKTKNFYTTWRQIFPAHCKKCGNREETHKKLS